MASHPKHSKVSNFFIHALPWPSNRPPEPEVRQSQRESHAPVCGRGFQGGGWLRTATFAPLLLALIGGAVAYVKGGQTTSTYDAYLNTR